MDGMGDDLSVLMIGADVISRGSNETEHNAKKLLETFAGQGDWD